MVKERKNLAFFIEEYENKVSNISLKIDNAFVVVRSKGRIEKGVKKEGYNCLTYPHHTIAIYPCLAGSEYPSKRKT